LEKIELNRISFLLRLLTMTDILCNTPLSQGNRTCNYAARYELCDENHENVMVTCRLHLRKRLNEYENPPLVIIHSIMNSTFIPYPNPLAIQWMVVDDLEETIDSQDSSEHEVPKPSYNLPLLIPIHELKETSPETVKYLTSVEHIHSCEQFMKYDEISEEHRPILSYFQRMVPKCDVKQISVDASCCVCMEDFTEGDDLMTLCGCGHTFHKGCIMNWYIPSFSNGSGKCPECREWIECEIQDEINPNINIHDDVDDDKDKEYILHMRSRC